MAFASVTSPHAHKPLSTSGVMRQVILATVPGIIALTYFFGWGVIINILLASATALASEALVLRLRQRNVMFYLKDCSALLTAVLLGIALPPLAPWWLVVFGTVFAIVIAKQLYGGMGYNPFNPAMVAYVLLLISFPVPMTQWASPRPMLEGGLSPLDFVAALENTFRLSGASRIDAYSAATTLDLFKQNSVDVVSELWANNPQFGRFGGSGWEWANLMFLLGGIYLLIRRIYTWHAPVSMLLALSVMAVIFYDNGSSSSGGSPLMHLFSGATMLGAFFIITDPVTSAVSTRGRIVFGACIGIMVYIIRTWGNYPDAVAFSVLLMNFAAPFIDHYTQPRTYGHQKTKAHK